MPKDKLVVLCCKSGQISDELAENLRDDGFNAVNLEGGYYSWLRSQFENEDYATDVEKASAKVQQDDLEQIYCGDNRVQAC